MDDGELVMMMANDNEDALWWAITTRVGLRLHGGAVCSIAFERQ